MAISSSAPRRVLTLLIELRCNNYCVFCGEREVDEALVNTRRRLGLAVPTTAFGATRGRYTLETATQALARARESGFTDLSLQGGEPTIFPDIVGVVKSARALGFGFVGMVTNGRKLRDRAFTEALLEAGLDGITISLLGHDAATHDAIAAAPGAFDALVTGLDHAAATARKLRRAVHVDANIVTSAKTVEHLADQVRLLASHGVEAASVHLVRFNGLASDPGVRGPLSFELQRISGPLARAWAEAERLGLSLSATDVPMCVHRRLLPRELVRMKAEGAVEAHVFEAAAFTHDSEHGRADYPACDGCMLARVCRKAPRDYLPADPAELLRPFTPEALRDAVRGALSDIGSTAADAGARVAELDEAVRLFGMISGRHEALVPAAAVVRDAASRLLVEAARRRDARALITAFCSSLGLHPPSSWSMDARAWSALALPPSSFSAIAAPAAAAAFASRLVLGDRFAMVIDGEIEERAGGLEVSAGALRPIVPDASTPAVTLARGLFLTALVPRLRSASRVRVTSEGIYTRREADAVWSPAWLAARSGAIRIERAEPIAPA